MWKIKHALHLLWLLFVWLHLSEYYMNNDFVHVKNERLYCSIKKDTIANQICHATIGERKKKLV
jgi:hypothetical protein